MMGMPLLVSGIVTLFVNLIVFSAVPFAGGLPGVRPDNFEVFCLEPLDRLGKIRYTNSVMLE